METAASAGEPDQARTRRSRFPLRRLLALAVAALVVLSLAGYLFVCNIVYDKATLIDQPWCAAVLGPNIPASFQARGEDDMPAFDMSAYYMPSFEDVSFPSRQPGITISGWWIRGTRDSSPAVVVVHGRGKCKHDAEVLLPAGMLHRAGFAVLLIDLRNHGDSTIEDGRFAGGVREYQDVLGAWDWLRSAQRVPASQIGLYGVSFGAATVTIATGQEPRIAATWEDSSWSDLGTALQDQLDLLHYPGWLAPGGLLIGRLLHGVDLTSISPADAVGRLHGRPFYIVHGDADQTVPVALAFRLADAARAGGETVVPWIVSNARHVRAAFVETGEYEQRLDTFFESALGHP